ncbi:MAG: HIT family protein [Candidatus Woesearchaeota archaeon]|jgi:diadenosine tetraphosphate (Ap4A) HIT family hydrolase
MNNCIFCNIDKWRIIYEDDFFYSIFDGNPVSPGHSLIISKRHAISILDLNKEEWSQLKDALNKVIQIIEQTNKQKTYELMIPKNITRNSSTYCEKMLQHKNLNQKPDGYNIGVNDGEAAGRTINHFHLQIIPRYFEDTPNPTGGISHIIPGMGNYKE